jgi:thiol-disulfide isomerase/thioredoxin
VLRALSAALAAALAAALPAQAVGTQAPDLEFQKTFNFGRLKVNKLSDLRGSAVLLEFWATWCGPCRAMIPHMNEFHANKELAKKGLVIVSCSDEPESTVEKFIPANGMNYGIALTNYAAYKVDGIPHAFLIDPKGKIVWADHPSRLNEGTFDAALKGARPPGGLAEGLASVSKLLASEQFGKAHAEAQRLLAGTALSAEARAQAEALCTDLATSCTELIDAGLAAAEKQEWYTAAAKLIEAKKYAGLPRTEEALAKLTELQADPAAKREIQAGTKLAEAEALEESKDYDKAHKAYGAVKSSFDGTEAATEAAEHRDALEKNNKLGFDKECDACREFDFACPKHSKKKKKR